MKNTEVYSYDRSAALIHLPGKIWGPTAKHNIRLVFDPGAYRTIIDTKITDALGYSALLGNKQLSTSSMIGKECGYTLNIQQLSLLSFEFSDIEIACFDLPQNYDIDGLVGLDLLIHFEITLRHKEHWIRFTRLIEE